MATREEVMDALRKADAAGNVEDAKRLARIARSMAPSKPSGDVTPNPDGTYGQPPEGMFVNPETGQMTSRELLRGNVETNRATAAGSGYLSGFSLGTVDEMAGVAGRIEGGPEMGNFRREQARAIQEANREDFPGTTLASEVGGAVLSPVTRALPATTTVRGGAAAGAAVASAEGFGQGEGGIAERATSAATSGATGLFFGGMAASLGKGVNAGVRRLFDRASQRPSIQTLQTAKNAAYSAVRRAGVRFDGNDTQRLASRVNRLARTARWDVDVTGETDKAAVDAINTLQRRAGKPLSLNNLDKTRQKLWDNYNQSGHPFVLEAIGEIDNLIATRAQGNEVMEAARLANSRYAKAQLLESAFKKARLQTAATGSGGNILNKYRQAVVSIITKPHEAKWFSPEELAVMEQFVEGDVTENVMRRIGKLAPGGNGLMTALNVYAATVDPAMLAVTATATGAKEIADRSAMRGSEDLLDAVSTGVIRTPRPALPTRDVGVAGAAAGNQLFGR